MAMHSAVEELMRLLPPPSNGGDMVDWEQVHAQFGCNLPQDYRDFVAVYGMGSISDSLGISAPPFDGHPYDDHLLYGCSYPAPGGVLRWGANEGADDFVWRCGDEDPDRWTVAVSTRGTWHDYDLGMAEFLVELVSGRVSPPLNARLTINPATFESWREEQQRMDEYAERHGLSWS
ncbi:hypothetical protein ACWGHU_10265 [Streptomyces xanthophaeus]